MAQPAGFTPVTVFVGTTMEITFVDRIKDAIRRRGENILLRGRIEVMNHPSVLAAAAVGVPGRVRRGGCNRSLWSRTRMRRDRREPAASSYLSRMPHFAVPRFVFWFHADLASEDADGEGRKHKLRNEGRHAYGREARGRGSPDFARGAVRQLTVAETVERRAVAIPAQSEAIMLRTEKSIRSPQTARYRSRRASPECRE